jgi:hypothetical protein
LQYEALEMLNTTFTHPQKKTHPGLFLCPLFFEKRTLQDSFASIGCWHACSFGKMPSAKLMAGVLAKYVEWNMSETNASPY